MRFWPAVVAVLLVGCSPVSDVSITRFESVEPESCRASDVALDELQIASFFKRAERIDGRTLHDEYNWAPCHLEGTLTYQGKACTWHVRAGHTGEIVCPGVQQYFGCKTCYDLFGGGEP